MKYVNGCEISKEYPSFVGYNYISRHFVYFLYNYFTQSSTKIQSLAVRELETNSEIEAFSISTGLESALYTISSNLELIAGSPSTMDWNISIIQVLLEKGLDSTSNITDGYYLLDKNGSSHHLYGYQ